MKETFDQFDNNQNYCISQEMRNQLRLDPKIGAGNFIFYAYKINPLPAVPILYLDSKFHAINGENYNHLSLDEIYKLVHLYATWYLTCGIQKKTPVAIFMNDGIGYLIHFMALTSIGAIPALINSHMNCEIAVKFINKIAAELVIVDSDHYLPMKTLFSSHGYNILIININTIILIDPNFHPYVHEDDDPIMITHSSGTTGMPKAICLQHSGFFYGIRYLLSLPAMEGIERLLSSLPSSHNSAIAYSMYALLSGVQLMISSQRVGFEVLKLIEKFKPSTIVSFPETYVQMLEQDLNKYDLSSISYWINSGDAAHERHIKALVKYGYHYRGLQKIQGSQFVDGLGSSEMGHTLFRIIHTSTTNTFERCIGSPQPWVSAVVLDQNGKQLSFGKIGWLGVKGPSITSGYWNESVLTHRSKSGSYWLTGDVVYQDDKGLFYHLDRIQDVIYTLQGPLYSIWAEELIMRAIDEIFDCSIVATNINNNITPAIFVLMAKGYSMTEKEILIRCNSILSQYEMPLLSVVYIVENVPRGITGKVLKRLLRDNLSNKVVNYVTSN